MNATASALLGFIGWTLALIIAVQLGIGVYWVVSFFATV